MQPKEKVLAELRLQQAHQCLASAKMLVDFGDSRGAVNRAYYAMFHGMRSVLALEGKDFAKHSGVISYFRKEYVKTGIFSKDLSDSITELFNSRSNSDYSDIWVYTNEEVMELIEEASAFIDEIDSFHNKRA